MTSPPIAVVGILLDRFIGEVGMPEDLHHSVWSAYRQAISADASWDASAAFQAALDVLLRQRPEIDARSACSAAVRMIMMPPRGARPRPTAAAMRAARSIGRAGLAFAQPAGMTAPAAIS